MQQLLSQARRLSRRHSGRLARAFTLIELVIVIAIIIILVMVLVIVILKAIEKGKRGDTITLFDSIQVAIDKWRQNKPQGACPPSGTNVQGGDAKYDGNKALYRALVEEPKARGEAPYLVISDKYVGEHKGQKLLIDGWEKPIVYWEWHSKTAASAGGSETPGSRGSVQRTPPPAWAVQKDSYDLYSSGVDKTWATPDDISSKGEVTGDGAPVKD